ncbi:unnamed protein product [Ectocarpus sp. 8 AP-2014]
MEEIRFGPHTRTGRTQQSSRRKNREIYIRSEAKEICRILRLPRERQAKAGMPPPPLHGELKVVAPAQRRRLRTLLLCLLAAAGATVAAAWVFHLRRATSDCGTHADVSHQGLTCGITPGGKSVGLLHEHQQEQQQEQQREQQEQQQRFFFFDAPDGPSAPGVGHSQDHHEQQKFQQRERRPPCADSDDPAYACLVPRPPGSFADEIMVYLSLLSSSSAVGDEQWLSVKVVVPAASRGGESGGGGGARWASLGFSPDGKMAGPSEAVVGFVGAAEAGSSSSKPPAAAGVLRYRMDGYRIASVTPLSGRHQVLTEQSVETTAEGSLIVRFKRPLVEAFSPGRDACAATAAAVGVEDTGGLEAAAAGAAAEVCSGKAGGSSMEWLDPRERGVVLLWAYGTGAWPSYHDATGAFVLPRLTAVEVD